MRADVDCMSRAALAFAVTDTFVPGEGRHQQVSGAEVCFAHRVCPGPPGAPKQVTLASFCLPRCIPPSPRAKSPVLLSKCLLNISFSGSCLLFPHPPEGCLLFLPVYPPLVETSSLSLDASYLLLLSRAGGGEHVCTQSPLCHPSFRSLLAPTPSCPSPILELISTARRAHQPTAVSRGPWLWGEQGQFPGVSPEDNTHPRLAKMAPTERGSPSLCVIMCRERGREGRREREQMDWVLLFLYRCFEVWASLSSSCAEGMGFVWY